LAPEISAPAGDSAQRTQILDTVLAIAAELGASADQVAIAWAGTHGAVPMIGPRSLAQLTSNLGALALGLSAEQLGRLDTVSSVGPSTPARKTVPWGSDERVRRAVA
jgi:aryl-alcohol dehydrogenase-like predicted oxidoreductase